MDDVEDLGESGIILIPDEALPPPPDREKDWDALFAALDRLGLQETEAWADLAVLRLKECQRVLVRRPDGRREWL